MSDLLKMTLAGLHGRAARAAWLACVAGLTVPAAIAAPGDLEVRRMCACYVTDLSTDGLAAAATNDRNYETLRWTWGGGAQWLGRSTGPKLHTSAGTPAISGDGTVVAATILDDTQAYGTQARWTASTGWQQLMPPRPDDGAIVDSYDGSVFGMSGDGQTITGLYWRNTGVGGLAHASRWTAGGRVVDLGSSGYASRVDGASRDGTVLAGWDEHPEQGYRRAAVWVNGVRTLLDEEPSEANKVNADGTVLVGTAIDPASGLNAAAMWTWNGSQWVRRILGVLDGTRMGGMAQATDLSDDGKVVVGVARRIFSPATKGFVWTAETGLLEAADYFKQRYGKANGLQRKVAVHTVSAISGDGRVMSVVGTDLATGIRASFAVRSAASVR